MIRLFHSPCTLPTIVRYGINRRERKPHKRSQFIYRNFKFQYYSDVPGDFTTWLSNYVKWAHGESWNLTGYVIIELDFEI